MKELLTEVYATVKKVAGIDPSKPGNLKAILVDDGAFETYITGLAESIENKKDRAQFVQLAENTRVSLLENSMFQINPYETLTLPILRVFYPKLVAKEAVTVSPMDKPETVKAFIRAQFQPSNSASRYDAPVTGTDISDEALKIAFENATINNTTVAFLKEDILSPDSRIDTMAGIIVGNPLYVRNSEKKLMNKNFNGVLIICHSRI